MRTVVVYESMFGNTRAVAEAVAQGLKDEAGPATAVAVHVSEVDLDVLPGAPLLVVGAPTHAWSLSRPSTRKGAADQAAKPGATVALEPGATGTGVREWLEGSEPLPAHVAVFDTHMKAPLGMSGHASRRITRRLRRRGSRVDAAAHFLVTKDNRLVDGELDRARAWGRSLAGTHAPVRAGRG